MIKPIAFRLVILLTSSLAATMLAATAATRCVAKDHFLTIGGGYNASSNQASIERNVLLLRTALDEQRPDHPAHDVFFADGAEPARDVQFHDEEQRKSCPPARRIMTEILGSGHAIGLCYRDHGIPELRGGTEKQAIERRFRELGRELKSGDRLIVYATGHGSQSYDNYDYDYESEEWVEKKNDEDEETDSNSFDANLHLWNNESISAPELSRWLDRLPGDVTVVLVMVQCYSGGFSHTIFHQNDDELGLSAGRRCGFFAQVHDRPAAGCTPEVLLGDGSPHEYSLFFWAALRGKTAGGEPIDADYDDNGQTSLAEAHSYAVIESETIDIPVRTSEELLRAYSRLAGGEDKRRRRPDDEPASGGLFGFLSASPNKEKDEKPGEPAAKLLAASGPLSAIYAQARPDQRAVLEQLGEKMKLGENATFESVRVQLRRATSQLATANVAVQTATSAHERTLEDLKADVYELWPELEMGISPTAGELMGERAAEFAAAIEALPSYQAFRSAAARIEEANERLEAAQKNEARAQRLSRMAETIALAANLRLTAPADVVQRYEEMLQWEEQPLAPTDGAIAP